MPQISIKEQIEYAEQEITIKKTVYKRWVDYGSMTKEKMDKEIATMEAIVSTLKSTKQQQDLPFDL